MKKTTTRVLALYPFTRGFGYAVFEGREFAIDWGVKEVRIQKNARCLRATRELITFYKPTVIVLEDCGGYGSRRCTRIKHLIRDIRRIAEENRILVHSYSRGFVKEVFARFNATNKYEIATIVAKQFPEFTPRLPGERKIWMKEDPRMSIFDAAALALTFFYLDD